MPLSDEVERKAVDKLKRDLQLMQDFQRPFLQEWKEAYRQFYLAKNPNDVKAAKDAGRAYLWQATAYQQVQSKLPRLVEALLAQKPWVSGYDPTGEDQEGAEAATLQVQTQLERAGLETKMIPLLMDVCVIGHCPVMVPERRTARVQTVVVPLSEYLAVRGQVGPEIEGIVRAGLAAGAFSLPADAPLGALEHIDMTTLEQIKVPLRKPIVEYEGPQFEVQDPFSFLIDPKARLWDGTGARMVARQLWLTRDDLEAANEEATMMGLPPVYFNLDKIRGHGGDGKWSSNSAQAIRAAAQGQTMPQVDDGAVECWNFWYEHEHSPVKPDMANPEGAQEFTLWGNEVLISARPNPFWDGKMPFYYFVHEPRPGQPYGTGLLRWIMDQIEHQRHILNTRIDNVNLMMEPPIFVRADGLSDPDDIRVNGLRPRQVIEVETGPNESLQSVLQPMNLNSGMTQQAYQESVQVSDDIEKITGLSPALSGQPIRQGRTTFSEVATYVDEGNLRIKVTIRLHAETMERIAEAFHNRNMQFAPAQSSFPVDPTMLRDAAPALAAQAAQAYGGALPSEMTRVPVTLPQPDKLYKFTWVGTSLDPLTNKQAKQQAFVALVQNVSALITQMPQLAMQVDWSWLLEQGFRLYEIPGWQKAVRRLSPAEQVMMWAQQDPQVVQAAMQITQQQVQQSIMEEQMAMQGNASAPEGPPGMPAQAQDELAQVQAIGGGFGAGQP